MIFCPNNLITESNVTVNGEVSSFPSANMLSDRLIEKTYFEGYIDIDFGVATLIDTIALVSSDTPFTLYANSSASWSSPAYTKSITSELSFISETYRYWRLIYNSYIEYQGIAYTSSGTDVDLTSPSDDYLTAFQFIPCNYDLASNYGSTILVGDYEWEITLSGSPQAGTTDEWFPLTSGTTYGTIKFECKYGTWSDFATSANDGLKTFTLPRLNDNDILGGSFKYYYHSAAWTYAFDTGTSDIVIAQNGSVFKGSISDANLVVRWDGKTGPSGSASPEVTVDIDRSANGGSASLNHFFLGNKLVFPNPRYGSVPNEKDTDIENYSLSRARFTTDGVQYVEQDFNFETLSRDDYERMKTFSTSSYRNNSGYFAQTEDNLTLFSPFFAKVKLNFTPGRETRERYKMTAKVVEQK